jgi:ribosomal protein S12 methylthiotransferase accessory factor
MQMDISIQDSDHMEARFDGLTVTTAQDGSAPAPFDLFLASIGTCGAFYVAKFCKQRNIPTGGIKIREKIHRDPGSRMVTRIDLELDLPDNFPEHYRQAVMRAAGLRSVKKHLAMPPAIDVHLA